MNHADAGANYLLKALLPRLEELKPGLLDELALGIKADKEAINRTGKMTAEIEQVFLSAEHILGRVPAQ
ncbi:MAG: hypothetical protein ACFB11_10665 [Paracoccaceae bacterium]